VSIISLEPKQLAFVTLFHLCLFHKFLHDTRYPLFNIFVNRCVSCPLLPLLVKNSFESWYKSLLCIGPRRRT
jgi:hypothetical protein